MNRDGGRHQPAPPAARRAADGEVDIFQIGEERRIEATDFDECGAIEGRGSTARGQRVEEVVRQHVYRLAVQVVETVERPVDDDACGIDSSLVVAPNENRRRHHNTLSGIEGRDQSCEEVRGAHDVVVEQDDRRRTRRADACIRRLAEAAVLRQGDHVDIRTLLRHELSRPVGRGVVDDDHLVREGLLQERRE